MKKVLRITGFVLWGILGAAVAAILITTVFFPGLPAYIAVKTECPNVNNVPSQWEYTDADIPDDFIEISAHGVTVSVPQDMRRKNPDSDIMLFWDGNKETDTKAQNSVLIAEPFDNTNFNSVREISHIFGDKLSEDELNKACELINVKSPENCYDYLTSVYSLSMDDFNIHSYKTAIAFMKIAETKESTVSGCKIYTCELNGIPAIIKIFEDEDDKEKLNCTVELFTGENSDIYHTLWISSYNAETVYSMISSIEISTLN